MLGTEGWGVYAFFQSFALYSSSFIDYSFSLWGTREVARVRDDPRARGAVLRSVIGAKLLMVIVVGVVTTVLFFAVPKFYNQPTVVWSSFAWGATLGLSALWYYQGLERMKLVAGLEILSRALATIAIFWIVRTPEQVWLVFALYAGSNLVSLAVALGLARADLAMSSWSIAESKEALRRGFPLFQTRIASNLYTTGGVFILGLLTTPSVIGIYAGAEKIVKAATVVLLEPLNRAIFPRQSYLLANDPVKAVQLLRIGFVVAFGGGMLLMGVLWIGAPLLVRYILGDGFSTAIPVLRILSLFAPIVAVSSVLGQQWLLPQGGDRPYSLTIWGAAVLNICLIILLVPRLEQAGMAWAVVSTELFVSVCFTLILLKKGSLCLLWKNKYSGKNQ